MNSWKTAAHRTLRVSTRVRHVEPGRRLMYYHSVHPGLPRSHRPDQFRRHLEAMIAVGVDFVTHTEAVRLSEARTQAPWVSLGFDDGYEDNHTVVLPILQEYGVLATFYVVASAVGPSNNNAPDGYHLYEGYRMLARSQVAELASAGNEIASHGLYHELATRVVSAGRPLASELATSRRMLGDMIDDEVKAHSYPNGQRGAFSDQTVRCVQSAGFRSSATTVWGRVTARRDPWRLPRCEVSMSDTADDLVDKISGRRDYLALVHRLRRTPTGEWSP